MKRVTGLGGVFFKCRDKAAATAWYRKHLGIESNDYGFTFMWREHESPERVGYTQWAPFKQDADYFGPGDAPFMVNYRVHDLVALIAALREEGVEIAGDIEHHENGKFAWIVDPDGRRIELWEPLHPDDDPYL